MESENFESQEIQREETEKKPAKRGRPKKEEAEKEYIAATNLFFHGVQIHAGAPIGYDEKLFNQGMIKEK